MKDVKQEVTRKLFLDKKTVMKLNGDMMRRIEGGFVVTSTGPNCDDSKTKSCVGCQTPACPSGVDC